LELLVVEAVGCLRIANQIAWLGTCGLFAANRSLFHPVELRFADFVFRIVEPALIGISMSHVSISSIFVNAEYRP